MSIRDIKEHNMTYLSLDPDQYARFEELREQNMSEWPDELSAYAEEFVRKHGLCGEVMVAAIADYVRGTDSHDHL